MRHEVEEFYARNNLPIDRILDVGVVNHGLHQEYQKIAIEQVYKQVEEGTLYLARHQIAWKIWELARDMRSRDRREAHVESYVPAKPVIPPAEVIEAMKEMPAPEIVIEPRSYHRGISKEIVIPTVSGIVFVALALLFNLYGG
jgi:hypothetical protein